ncbi:ion channel protein [Cellulosimicrobium terreum]|nr:ion channel protein [Cellulosimicrobium terreum]
MSGDEPGATPPPTTRSLARTIPLALVVGVLSALTLLGLSELAEAIQRGVWDALPQAWGLTDADGDVPSWWILAVLTVTGLLVGATVRWMPGHAGNDPAATGLVAPPIPIAWVPGLAVALVLGLAGGVSLGPENPIIAINVALAAWIVARPRAARSGVHGPQAAVTLATAGTIGALFATPVAAVLILTETFAERGSNGTPLFDRLFAPLVAASAGAMTMMLLGSASFAIDLPAYSDPSAWDIVSGAAVALCAALVALLGALAMPALHRAFHALRHPVVALGAGGVVLGVLGMLGGEISLFKGLAQMQELAQTADERTWYGIALLAVIKMAALVVAAAAGFRGGRIFPTVFIGVAVGLAASSLVPAVPVEVAVGAGVLGAVIVVDRDGWIALFMAAVVVSDVQLLPLLCLILVPVWLAVRRLPQLLVAPTPGVPEFAALGTAPSGRG